MGWCAFRWCLGFVKKLFGAFRFKLIDQKDLIRWESLGSYMSVQKSHKSV